MHEVFRFFHVTVFSQSGVINLDDVCKKKVSSIHDLSMIRNFSKFHLKILFENIDVKTETLREIPRSFYQNTFGKTNRMKNLMFATFAPKIIETLTKFC